MYTSVRRAKWNWGFVGRPLRSWWYSWLRVTSEECEIQPDPILLHLQAASKVKFTFENFWDPTHIPSWSKLPICAKSGLVFLSGQDSNPKVHGYREKFNIGNVAQIFFVVFYTCWEYAMSFSEKFSMLKFSPSPSTSPSPLSGPYFEKGEISGFLFFSKWKWKKKIIGIFFSYSIGTSNVKNDFQSI